MLVISDMNVPEGNVYVPELAGAAADLAAYTGGEVTTSPSTERRVNAVLVGER